MREMSSRIGLVGDVHAEDAALATVLGALEGMGVDAIVCVGDIVDGVGSVDRCCALLRERRVITVRGNHERWFLGGTMRDLAGANPVGSLQKSTVAYLASLPATIALRTVVGESMLCHGLGPKDMARLGPDDFGYALEVNEDLQELLRSGVPLVIGGHTHQRMVRRFGATRFVNAGTLKRGCNPCFGLLDLQERTVQFFDLDGAARYTVAERMSLDPAGM